MAIETRLNPNTLTLQLSPHQSGSLSTEQLLEMYRHMVLIRRVEESLLEMAESARSAGPCTPPSATRPTASVQRQPLPDADRHQRSGRQPGVGAIEKRPVVVSQGHPLEANTGDYLAFLPMLTLGLSYDRRILDGATADAVCLSIKETLENWQ